MPCFWSALGVVPALGGCPKPRVSGITRYGLGFRVFMVWGLGLFGLWVVRGLGLWGS